MASGVRRARAPARPCSPVGTRFNGQASCADAAVERGTSADWPASDCGEPVKSPRASPPMRPEWLRQPAGFPRFLRCGDSAKPTMFVGAAARPGRRWMASGPGCRKRTAGCRCWRGWARDLPADDARTLAMARDRMTRSWPGVEESTARSNASRRPIHQPEDRRGLVPQDAAPARVLAWSVVSQWVRLTRRSAGRWPWMPPPDGSGAPRGGRGRSAFWASLFARSGASCTSRKTPSTPRGGRPPTASGSMKLPPGRAVTPVAAARQLQAVRHVEHDGRRERARSTGKPRARRRTRLW